jgi:hypothetical protein
MTCKRLRIVYFWKVTLYFCVHSFASFRNTKSPTNLLVWTRLKWAWFCIRYTSDINSFTVTISFVFSGDNMVQWRGHNRGWGGGGTPQRSCTTVGWGLKSILTFTGKKMWNPYYEICSYTTKSTVYHTISILYPYYGNIQLLWITKIHSISNKGPYNFHSMTFYGFSKFWHSVIWASLSYNKSCCINEKLFFMFSLSLQQKVVRTLVDQEMGMRKDCLYLERKFITLVINVIN